jgi:hypothetical protein
MKFNKNLTNHIANLGSMQLFMDAEPTKSPDVVFGSNYGEGESFLMVSMEVMKDEEEKEFGIKCYVETANEKKEEVLPLHSSAKSVKDWFENNIMDFGFIRSWVKVEKV